VLALYDPVLDHRRASCRTPFQSRLYVLGRGPLCLPADAALHCQQLHRLQRQGKADGGTLLKLRRKHCHGTRSRTRCRASHPPSAPTKLTSPGPSTNVAQALRHPLPTLPHQGGGLRRAVPHLPPPRWGRAGVGVRSAPSYPRMAVNV
jgi:hypothetical protein